MKKLSVNFYGEEVSIQLPKDFASLRKEIAQNAFNKIKKYHSFNDRIAEMGV